MPSLQDIFDGLVIGAHLVSAHSSPGLNNTNPGLYVRSESGFTFGAYENSISRTRFGGNNGSRRISTYAGWSWETDSRNWAITLGGVTGYGRPEQDVCVELSEFGGFGCNRTEHLDAIPRVIPLAVLSGRVPLSTEWAMRLGYVYVPGAIENGQRMHIANLMMEYRWR